ncbi:MAG: MTAP family purine nucleoside phosphorylase [Bacillota bacterium]
MVSSIHAEIGDFYPIPLALIGGSATFSLRFPEDLEAVDIQVVADNLVFVTPFGESPPFKIFTVGPDARRVISVKMHGWRPGTTRADASRQVFWVFREAGVQKILAEGGVGSVNHLLDPLDMIIPNDYIDFSSRRDVDLGGGYLCIMRQPICPDLHGLLVEAARSETPGRVFPRGVYVVTDGRHFESPAEVSSFRQWGADIVGQSLCPEVYLAREIGACYAGAYLVVNYGEGVVKPWEHQVLKDIFFEEAAPMGRLILRALRSIDLSDACQCSELRKPTLLRQENVGRKKEDA